MTNALALSTASRTSVLAPRRRAKPRGFERFVMRVSVAMLLWARRRADRATPTREEFMLRRANEIALEQERRRAEARIARLF